MIKARQSPEKSVTAVMPALLVSVRHGETNTSDLSIANRELPLTREGFRQARRAGVWITEQLVGSEVLPATQFDRAYFSPYERSRQTMGGIAMHAPIRRVATPEPDNVLAMTTDLRLRELHFGDASLMTPEQMRANFEHTTTVRAADTLLGRTPNGDSVADVHDRVRNYLGRLTRGKERGENHVLAVSHGRTTRALQLALMGIDPKNWLEFDSNPNNKIGYTTRVMFSRYDPVTGKEHPTYHWTATSHMTPGNDEPPRWQEFEAPVGTTIEDCLAELPPEWLTDPF